ncbi:MAG TPA: hypothetical protein DCL21_02070 [Alphaproteobacteria bacterium]|nr:hypothetical protein [Alphaproteobacteria bacterium]
MANANPNYRRNQNQAIRQIDRHFSEFFVEADTKHGFDVRVLTERDGEEVCFFDSTSIEGGFVVGCYSDGSGPVHIPMH